MPFVADLHIHSHYSRSTSKLMNIEALHRWAQLKGIAVLGTGDFTHPQWFAELREKLEPAEPGLFRLKKEFAKKQQEDVPESCRADVRFMLSAEISCIYSKDKRTRKVHNLVYCPDFASAARVNAKLGKIGNLASDGRPILGLDSRHLLEIALEAGEENFFVPAHAWTPHFSIFGAFSGFHSLEDCFGDLAGHIHAIETGLSSDPPMNWRLSQLDNIALISNSDAHSPAKLAREANVLEADMSYAGIVNTIIGNDPETFLCTLEFFPEEGKYHVDGHRKCGVRLTPKETLMHDGRCPECGRKITVGVSARVETMADREPEDVPPGRVPFESLVPLQEIVSELVSVGVNSKKVQGIYFNLLETLGNELYILRHAPLEDLAQQEPPLLAEAVRRMRARDIHIEPGYDGEYGTVQIFKPGEIETLKNQNQLSLF